MKKELLITFMLFGLTACSSWNTTTYHQASNSTLEIKVPATTLIYANSLYDFSVPQYNKATKELGGFKIKNNVYDSSGKQIVIPEDAVISAIYSNDSRYCIISWQNVYYNKNDFIKEKPAFSVKDITENSSCNPGVGIQKDDSVTLRFK
jgi:hypothetical protein